MTFANKVVKSMNPPVITFSFIFSGIGGNHGWKKIVVV